MMAADLLAGSLGTAALLLPGWITARVWRVPQPVLAGFIGGAVALTSLVLALDTLHLRLSFASVGTTWLCLTLLAAAAAWRQHQLAPAPVAAARFRWREHGGLLAPLAFALAVVAYRAIAQPLFGVDTVFRWNWLAQQMLARGTLDFYPPVSAADYELYAWPDGIAPAVSTLYFWCYALARATRPVLTAPLVIFQFTLLVAAAFALARRMYSDRAAAFTVALLACSPLLLWATAMGQETGLTALSLIALLLWLPRSRSEENTAALIAAGLAAGLGALAREYGLAWPVLGLALLVTRKLSPRAIVIFAATAALGALPWYARNWARTGHPFFNLDLAGCFPVNTAHTWLTQSFQQEFGWSHLPPEALRLVATNAPAALLGAAAGALLFLRASRALLVAGGLVVALWLAALGYTAAGFIYALRVLSPALVLGGAACARWLPARRHLAGVSLALGVFAADAALRALVLPANVYKLPPAVWLEAGRALQDYHARPIYRALAQRAGLERILVLGPNALLTAHGAGPPPPKPPAARRGLALGAAVGPRDHGDRRARDRRSPLGFRSCFSLGFSRPADAPHGHPRLLSTDDRRGFSSLRLVRRHPAAHLRAEFLELCQRRPARPAGHRPARDSRSRADFLRGLAARSQPLGCRRRLAGRRRAGDESAPALGRGHGTGNGPHRTQSRGHAGVSRRV
ncbi:MAG: hypothetical protein EXS32_12430 [Opitutus sp.]|nr:hypothetical protein [Opitutus sp.]